MLSIALISGADFLAATWSCKVHKGV